MITKDPKRKRERRLERERKRDASNGKSRPDEIFAQPDEEGGEDEAMSRYIWSKLRLGDFASSTPGFY